MSDDTFDNVDETANADVFAFPQPSATEALLEWQSRPSTRPLVGLIGDSSGRRLWASECDFLLAVIASMMLVIVLPNFDPLLKGLTFYVFFLLYFQLTEYFAGATPAKWWFGLRVRSVDGHKATFMQVAIRTAWRVLEINPIFMGAFPAAIFIAVTRRHVRLGDMMARTVVVRVENL